MEMGERTKRVIRIVILMAVVVSTGFFYQWMQEAPDWGDATERGYFQAIMVPVCYWFFKIIGWINPSTTH
jgi:hypothetical protein